MIPLFLITVLIFADFRKDGAIFRVVNLTGKKKTFRFQIGLMKDLPSSTVYRLFLIEKKYSST